MPAADAHKLRQAALALHALSADDMKRVWQRLDDAQRDTLSPLLDELDSLGIPKGRQWLDGDMHTADSAAHRALPDNTPDRVRMLSRLSAHEALTLLTSQSLDTAIAIMHMAPWPWLDQVVENWPPEHRHTVHSRIEHKPVLPARLVDTMLQSMASQAIKQKADARPVPAVKPASKRTWYRSVMSLFLLT